MMSHEMSQVIAYLLFSVTCHMSTNLLLPSLLIQCTKTRGNASTLYYTRIQAVSVQIQNRNDLDES